MVRPLVYLSTSAEWSYGRGVLYGILHYAWRETNWQVGLLEPRTADALPAQIAGLIVHRPVDMSLAKQAGERKIPMVWVGDTPETADRPTVQSDHQAIGRLAARHLLERGFRRLGYFGIDDWYATQRYLGFVAEAKSKGASVLPLWLQPGKCRENERRIAEWARALQPPAGVMAAHDGLAGNVLDICRCAGLKIPEDVAVIGVDNDRIVCETYRPTITSVVVASRQIGRQAAALLSRLIDGRPYSRQHIALPPLGIFPRESTATFVSDDPLVAKAVKLMQQDFDKRMPVSELSAVLATSRRKLESHFQAALGRAPAQVHRHLRIERARHMLQTTALPLRTIALDCGFKSRFHFARVFRQETGVTPSRYRAYLGAE